MEPAPDTVTLQEGPPPGSDRRQQGGLYLPEREPVERAIVAGIFVLATSYLFLFRHGAFSPDEGITLQGAQRILDGQVMYRDFFYFCTPGSYYFLALLFRVFGDSINVARTWLAVEGGFFAVLTYVIARRVCARWSTLLTACLVTIVALPSAFFVLHNWDSTLWACLTLYFAVWFLQEPHWGWGLAMGSCCSITALFEQSKGGGLLLGLAAGFVILELCRQRIWRRTYVVAALGGLVWPLAAAFFYFAAKHSLVPMVRDLFFPFRHFYTVGVVPYGYLTWGRALSSGSFFQKALISFLSIPYFVICALPIFGVGILIYTALRIRRMRGVETGRWPYYVLMSACTTGLLLSVIATRKDVDHFVMIGPIFVLILAWFLDGSDFRLNMLGGVMPLVVVTVTFAFLLVGLTRLLIANSLVPHETRKGPVNVSRKDTALDYLLVHTREGEEIFVYPYNPAYYYLTGTSNPTRYDFLHPGLNSPAQVKEVLKALATRRPRIVVFETSFYEGIIAPFPLMPMRVLASRSPIEDFILEKYKPCAALLSSNLGHLVFMVREDLTCPETAGKRSSSTSECLTNGHGT